jgi:fatty-acyl-CoA synthase
MFGEVGLAVVAVQPGTTLTLDTITEYLDGRLARFKHPRALRLVDALPRNATGKIARGQLRETYSNHATH